MSEISVVILSIGTELTEGIIRDSHGQFLSSELTARGFSVRRIEQLPDNDGLLARFQDGVNDADVVIITGGLGPTADDITRDAVANLCGKGLEFREDVWEMIKDRFPRLCGNANQRQAMIPEGCDVLDNPFGTAPGFRGEVDGTLLFVLPGPPKELRGMAELHLFPFVEHHFALPVRELSEASIFLIGESRLEEACREIAADNADLKSVLWGTRVQERRISLYLRGGREEDRLRFLDLLAKKMGKELVRLGDLSAEQILFSTLKERRLTFAAAESCTGGMLGSVLTSLPGSSAYFLGSCVSYADSFKRRFLGVGEATLSQYGAVSRECAMEMALGVLDASGADVACSITGIAGPSGGSVEKPVGTVWFGLAGKDGAVSARQFRFGFSRDSVRRRATVTAMLLTEIYLDGDDALDMCGFWQYS